MNRGEILKLSLQHTSDLVDALALAKDIIDFLDGHDIQVPARTSALPSPKPFDKREKDKIRAKNWREKMKRKVGAAPKKYHIWETQDIVKLMEMMRDKKSLHVAAKELGRTYGATYLLSKQIRRGAHAILWESVNTKID